MLANYVRAIGQARGRLKRILRIGPPISVPNPPDNPAGTPEVHQLAPSEYLEYLISEKTRSFLEENKEFDIHIGTKTELIAGFPVQTIANRKAYTAFIARGGLTPEEVKDHLAFEDSLPLDRVLSNVRDNKAFLENLIPDCIELVPEHKAKLMQVPVGFAHTKLLEAGAIPVPSGGNVVLVSTKIQMIRHWLACFAVIGGLAPLISRASVNSSYSESDKLKIVRLLPKLAQYILDAQPFPELLLLTQVILPVLNEFEIQLAGCLVEQFIILHEFGHIALGHMDHLREFRKSGLAMSGKEIEARLNFELEADRFAGHALRESSPEGMAFGLDGFFSLLYFAEQTYRGERPLTHPPASTRYQIALEAYLEQEAPELHQVFLDKANVLTAAWSALPQ